jgi:splicing factor 3B subunit 3
MCAAQESVHFFRYNKADNKLYCFADDIHPRYVTHLLPLDYDTVALADKFGNFSVLRLPEDVSLQVRGGGGGGLGKEEGGRQGKEGGKGVL